MGALIPHTFSFPTSLTSGVTAPPPIQVNSHNVASQRQTSGLYQRSRAPEKKGNSLKPEEVDVC